MGNGTSRLTPKMLADYVRAHASPDGPTGNRAGQRDAFTPGYRQEAPHNQKSAPSRSPGRQANGMDPFG